ncbi:MAG TPA: pyridoxamine 5'-phosphate oxidase [Candidatus Limnocylindrales bacterium]|nr:pyridoxamine 5'-phosphate oxidase [Candidatus Limnocylindrales bacterium]
MNLSDFREDYQRGALDRAALDANPITQFESWFRDATGEQSQSRWRKIGIALFKLWSAICNHRPADINAMTLATVDQNGKPSTRTVLLKTVDERGFIFFTNYDSRKGRELAENPNAALTFFWPDLERQVCVAGTVTKLPVAVSEAYFKSRPRGSRLAAWASNQSEIVSDRAALEAKWRELEKKFPNDVPLPPNWGGFILAPERIEFWQGRPSRLHDRFSYTRQADGAWKIERLAP